MKKYKLLIIILAVVGISSVFKSCEVEPTYYSQSTPELFFDTQEKVYQRMGRAFTHWAWCMADNQAHSNFIMLQEFTTDEMLVPSRYNDWYDGGNYLRMYHHDFTPTTPGVYDAWRAFSMGVAQAWSAKDDIDQYVDFDALGFPEGSREAVLMQLQTLSAFFYWFGLDMFGGVPLYTSTQGDIKPRATDVETFEFIDSLLTEAIPQLPKKTVLGAQETGAINQAAAALLKARLYFNAESYIRKDMYAEAAAICQDIIDGKYGTYALENEWTNIFGFDNDSSTEIIWSVPSQNAISERSTGPNSNHYGMGEYWSNGEIGNRNNGYCLVPSLDVEGKSYLYGSDNPSSKGTYRLGSPFAKFHEDDVRKLYNLLRINPELLLSKFNVIYDSKVDPIETMMFSRNPLNDQRREVESYIQQVRFYLISKFFDVKQQKTRIAQDMIDYPGSQVISEINIILKSFSYDDAVKIGEEYFEQVFSQIGFTLLHR
jgi:hypothetical protein